MPKLPGESVPIESRGSTDRYGNRPSASDQTLDLNTLRADLQKEIERKIQASKDREAERAEFAKMRGLLSDSDADNIIARTRAGLRERQERQKWFDYTYHMIESFNVRLPK